MVRVVGFDRIRVLVYMLYIYTQVHCIYIPCFPDALVEIKPSAAAGATCATLDLYFTLRCWYTSVYRLYADESHLDSNERWAVLVLTFLLSVCILNVKRVFIFDTCFFFV